MRKSIFLGVVLCFFQTGAFAFELAANCQFNHAFGKCVAWNTAYRPVRCSLHADGHTSRGFWIKQYANIVILPGQNAHAYVYASNPNIDPLVAVTGHAACSLY